MFSGSIVLEKCPVLVGVERIDLCDTLGLTGQRGEKAWARLIVHKRLLYSAGYPVVILSSKLEFTIRNAPLINWFRISLPSRRI